ncbi:MAG: Sulfatase modifying factor 1 precursor (C-alpha-formyglycine- generating enzyme 1) [uncultured Thermomicrobiales bacterium]|uniref:Sulfatase modifying factor 1 (C-alpha-formyglycine- generating enzyme 1) n=1 Tax=uncultured Thermomicrobiales bacterium TaxID=1645740 RepID=A0A6J4U7Q0_9BACT|nr:MAG: Sulfatase modifying factor 1 precursor (C-alpha-formyglycine- generating enzyme 1) [uncultured Thermomicrobiales bacterium]
MAAGTTPSRIAPAAPSKSAGMVLIPGGTFRMGNHRGDGYPADGEHHVHDVGLAPFWIDATAVTNARFAAFVEATGHITDAERFGWSFVFGGILPDSYAGARRPVDAPWWRQVFGAAWRTPEGPHSDLTGRSDHPVVHVSWTDAMAFCAWSGTRLPTEAEWECAARGGRADQRFPWGDELNPGGKHRMNVWQGAFPGRNSGADGFKGTAPVTAYELNDYGLSNMTGNVWEWCADWFAAGAYQGSRLLNPTGPTRGISRVMRGGSYLCHRSYCNRYRVDARSSNTPDSSTGNCGFRCARSA